MTQWRDARLAQALAHAPDAQDAPAATTRAAILRHAHQAVAPAPQPSSRPSPRALAWWQRWTGSGPGRPWNAAFASVLLAGVVTSLWWGQEVPGPVAEHSDAPAKTSAATSPAADAQQAPTPAPAPPSPSPSPSPSPAAARPAQPAAAAAPDTRQRHAEAEAQAQTRAKQRAEAPPRIAAPAPTQPEPPSTTTPSRQDEQQVSAMAKGSAGMPPPALSESPAPAPAAPPPPAPVAPPAPAAPSAPATTADAASASAFGRSAAAARLRAAPTPADAWTGWRLLPGGQAPVAREAMPRDMAQLLDGLLRAGSGAAPQTWPVLVRAELLRGNAVLGLLELGEQSLRWTPAEAGAASFTAPLEPALAARLRAALVR